jgi:lactate dehydrogenase-like 2-hydroxyacid dehydrogenase
VKIGVAPIVPFFIFTNVWYNQVKIANDEATLWASYCDLKKSIKKSDVLSIQEE